MLRKYLIVSAVAFFFVIFSTGFAAASSKQEAVKYVPDFNYTPASQAAPGSAGVAFAIGSTVYSYQLDTKIPWVSYPEFDNLDKAIRQDLTKILMAKGFSVRGPFDSYDLIPYPDKKAVDLYLIPTFELSLKFKPEKTSAHCTGSVEVNGKIALELREIITRELMWSKSIPFTKFEFPYSIHIPQYDQTKPYDLKPFIMDDVAKGIEKQYPDLMATVFKLIDPEEMGIIKKQCQELRSKKGY